MSEHLRHTEMQLAPTPSLSLAAYPTLPHPNLLQACLDPSKEVTVMVYDNCDKCGADQINLSGNVFTKLASLNVGKVDVEYKAVSCGAAAQARVCLCMHALAHRLLASRCLQTRAGAL